MTTLAAWVGVDQRAPASLYIVSDSRFTAVGPGLTTRVLTDKGQKIFACKKEPHLFGYWGWVAFPLRALSNAVVAIDAGTLFRATDDASLRQRKFESYLESRLATQLTCGVTRSESFEFAVLHATREGSGMQSVFRLWILGWHPKSRWNIRERKLTERSEVLYAGGSGREAFVQRDGSWKDSALGRTSRGVFSAFVEALSIGHDPKSGGAPQLGGLFRQGRAMEFGVIYKGMRFLGGKPVTSSPELSDFEWFNELFERADPVTLQRLPKAQRHAKPSWLRSWQDIPH